jgi:hypothetical protein
MILRKDIERMREQRLLKKVREEGAQVDTLREIVSSLTPPVIPYPMTRGLGGLPSTFLDTEASLCLVVAEESVICKGVVDVGGWASDFAVKLKGLASWSGGDGIGVVYGGTWEGESAHGEYLAPGIPL